MTKRNPEFGGFSACFAVRAGTDRKGKATPPARTETDWAQTYTAALHGFQPTPPARTETSGPFVNVAGVKRFQPTPPARTETESIEYHEGEMEISTHSAREDGDLFGCMPDSKEFNFNPLRPRGRRHGCVMVVVAATQFQPTPPARTETAILHKKTNNSSSHFHNQITSYSLKSPPTCPAHIQNRSHCAVFPVRIPP